MLFSAKSHVHERSADRGWRASVGIFVALGLAHIAVLDAVFSSSQGHLASAFGVAALCAAVNLLALGAGVRQPAVRSGFVTIVASVGLWTLVSLGLVVVKAAQHRADFTWTTLPGGAMLGLLFAVVTAPLAHRGSVLHHPRTTRDDAGEAKTVAFVCALGGDLALAFGRHPSGLWEHDAAARLLHGAAWTLAAAGAGLLFYAVWRELADRRALITALSGRSPEWRIDPVSKWMNVATTLPIMRWLPGPSYGVLVRVGVQPGIAYREAAEPTEEPLARLPLGVATTSTRVFVTALAAIFQSLVLLAIARG